MRICVYIKVWKTTKRTSSRCDERWKNDSGYKSEISLIISILIYKFGEIILIQYTNTLFYKQYERSI